MSQGFENEREKSEALQQHYKQVSREEYLEQKEKKKKKKKIETPETCPICRNGWYGKCLECEGDPNKNEDLEICKPAVGTCDHTFHEHCIRRWLEKRYVCPLCTVKWVFKKKVFT